MGRKKNREQKRGGGRGISRDTSNRLWKDIGPMYIAFLVCYPVAYLAPVILDSRFHQRQRDAIWGALLAELLSVAVYGFFHAELSKRENDSHGVVRDLFVNGLLSVRKVTTMGAVAGVVAGAMPSATGYLATMLGTGLAIDANIGRLVLGPYCALLTVVAVLSYEVLDDVRARVFHRRPLNKLNRVFISMWWVAIAIPMFLITYSLFPKASGGNGRGAPLEWDAPFSWIVALTFVLVLLGFAALVLAIARPNDEKVA